MPGMTPLGIVYPCGVETIDPAVFAQYADSTQAALAAADAESQEVTQPPAAQLTRPSATFQNISAGVSTAISWDTENYDTGGMFTLASPTILTVQESGTYLVSTQLTVFNQPTTGLSLRQAILLNGAERAFNKSDALTGAFGYATPIWASALLPSVAAGAQIGVNALFTGTGTMGISALISATKLSST